MDEDRGERRPEPERRLVDRRRFLAWTWKAAAVGLAAEAGWTTYDILVPRPAGGFGAVVTAGAEGAFPEGEVRYFPEGRFYVTRVQGELIALFQKCPHLGCRVPYCETSGRFECPCHGSVFNRKGEYLAGPAPRGMDSFPIRLERGKVLVDTGSVQEGPPPGRLTFREEPRGPSCLGEVASGHPTEPHEHEEPQGGGEPHEDGNPTRTDGGAG